MEPPIGRHLYWIARLTHKAFNDALESAGSSLPAWLILLHVEKKRFDTQTELASAIGIESPTLTHHLDAMEHDGLVKRVRDVDNRRAIKVELTEAGREMFSRLHDVAIGFEEQLRTGVSDDEVAVVRSVLDRFGRNVSGQD
jgi:MarR family transcriptional regulator for hemolysin